MSKLLSSGQGRIAFQICAVGAVAALMSGCSADSTRFGDAFGNPFATGSIQKTKPKSVAARKPPISGTGAPAPIVSSALPPRGATVVASAPVRQPPVAVSHETTGSIGPSRTVPGNSFGGWTGEGGAGVTVGQGDTAAVLAQRYGVPEPVLLQVNGLHAASEIQPGGRIVVPIYNAVAARPGAAPHLVEAAPVHEAAVRSVPAHVAEAAPAEPVRRAEPVPFKVAKEDTRAEKAAQAEREAATRKALAQKAAAEKVAADKLAAEKIAAAQKAAATEKLAKAEAAAARKVAVKSAPARAERSAETQKMAEAQKAAAADKAAAAQTAAAAAREAAKAKADAVKAAAVAAKAAKVAAATPAPAVAAPAKSDVAQPIETKKPVDDTPTASVPPASADAATGAAGGPEFRWPARGRIIAGFKGGSGGNDGINIAVPDGTPVKAAEGGVVAYAGSELKGYGNLVLIKHPNGYVTAYANNGEIDVKRGESVKRGQTIAKSGQSGNVSSPQLHFELRKGSQPVDPTNYLAGL